MQPRVIVTGQTASGKSVIVSDSHPEPVTVSALPGYEFWRVWGNDSVTQLPADGTPTPQPRYFPPKHGFRFGYFTLPPDASAKLDELDMAAALGDMEAKLPGVAETLEPDHPGMHTTDTVDFDIVLAGEVVLELDDGVEVTLRAGDSVVQNGTRHAWHNRTTQNALLAFCLVGAERKR